MDLLTASVSSRETYALVSLAGEADVTVRDRLREVLTAEVLAGTPALVVDLSNLGFMDSSCVHVLLAVGRMAEAGGGTLRLAAPRPVVARMMALWGADHMIAVFGSVGEASAAG